MQHEWNDALLSEIRMSLQSISSYSGSVVLLFKSVVYYDDLMLNK